MHPLNVVRRILSALLLLALLPAGAPLHALGMAAHAALGDDMCLAVAPSSDSDGRRGGVDGVAPLPCADCCPATVWSDGVPPNQGREAPLRRAFFPASPMLETVTTTGLGDILLHVLWIRGPPAAVRVA
ncbi:hypothetical protein JZU48_05375 [bacterium]|nr:hypothetical protein [bacterium]